jgi:hypothetical protein
MTTIWVRPVSNTLWVAQWTPYFQVPISDEEDKIVIGISAQLPSTFTPIYIHSYVLIPWAPEGVFLDITRLEVSLPKSR